LINLDNVAVNAALLLAFKFMGVAPLL